MYKIFIYQLELKVAIFEYLNFAIFVLIFHNKFLFSFRNLLKEIKMYENMLHLWIRTSSANFLEPSDSI